LANRYNNRKIVKIGQKVAVGKLLPGMILTFNYSEKNVKDPRPILLFLHNNPKINVLEGINVNYLNPTKLKKLFSVIEFKKGKLEEEENLVFLKEDYFRIQISNPKKRSAMSTKRFYSDVILADKYFKQAYRSYKIKSLTSLQVSQINTEFIR
tara:strand:+ start:898 stop:1356 length:459 start_codon:yes stop_codon:yes gene_type:complete